MTAQIEDRCEWQGALWLVYDVYGPQEALPAPEWFGLRTRMAHTANWRGYSNNYRVDEHGHLWLVRMNTFLEPGGEVGAPAGSRCVQAADMLGDVAFEFEAYLVPFSGTLHLGREEQVLDSQRDPDEARFGTLATLTFEKGLLTHAQRETRSADTSGTEETF